MPLNAPGKVVRFQNREPTTICPKPAHAKETMSNTELFGFLARITPKTTITIIVTLAAIILNFGDSFKWKASCRRFWDTLEDAVRSWESAVDIVLAKMPDRINPT